MKSIKDKQSTTNETIEISENGIGEELHPNHDAFKTQIVAEKASEIYEKT